MRVIGLDLGTQCGYAWSDHGLVSGAFSGEWDLSPSRHEGGGMRFLRFEQNLRILLDPEEVTPAIEDPGRNAAWFRFVHHADPPGIAVFYEIRPPMKGHTSSAAAEVYGGLLATLQSLCERRSIPYRGLTVQEVKKRATGSGRASKEAMVAAAEKEFNVRIGEKAHNRADALWVLQSGLDELGGG